jgi:hypothetical protein
MTSRGMVIGSNNLSIGRDLNIALSQSKGKFPSENILFRSYNMETPLPLIPKS